MLSIAIPFHRGVDYLEEALASVRAQTCPDWLVHVYDDGPEPGAAAVVAGFRDARFSYQRVEGRGMAANWNRGLDAATTDLATLLHADDRLLPNYVALMHAAAERYPAATAFFCNATIIGPSGERAWSFADWIKHGLRPGAGVVCLRGQTGLAAVLRGNFIMCPTVCYRRSLLGSRRFSEGAWQFAHDFAFFTQLLLDGDLLIGLPEHAYAYRRHTGNATVELTRNLRRFHEELALYDACAARCQARRWLRAARIARGKAIIRANLTYCAVMDAFRGDWRATWDKLGLALHGRAGVAIEC